MNRLVSRSLEILGQATKEIGQDYTSNLTSFVNDAKNVKDSIVKSTTDASDTFAKLKTTNITKKISDWFYQEENSSDASGDEFDPGFKIDSSEDEANLDGEKKPTVLSTDSMSGIIEKQSGMMVKIGRRQTEQSIANTAEVISVLNSRTSEMITSMNNINKSLIGISDKLDKLIKLQTVEVEENKTEDKSGIYDSSGNLSLMRIFEQAKQNMSNNSVVSTAQIMGQMITGGGGPVDVAKFLMGFGLGKPLNALGGESIDSLGKKFNEMIGTSIQTGLNEVIKSGPFKSLFGNIAQFEGDKDYGTIAANNYTTKKAMFDGMTRMSIVNIIPEYLAKINQALSGETWHVDPRGRLVKGPVENKFNEVTRNAFASSGLSSSAQNKILATGQRKFGDKISANDINEAGRALCGAIVMFKHYNGNSEGSFSVSDLKKDMSQYIFSAVNTLCNTPGRNDPEYWYSVCQMIVSQLASGLMDASQFVRNVNTSLDNMKRSAIEVAKSGKPEALQAGRLTNDIMIEQWIATHQDANKNDQQTQPNPPPPTPTDGNTKVERVDKYYIDGKHTTGDFIRGIFGILNRGINVKVLDKNDTSWKFEDYDLERQTVKQEIIDSKAAELFGQWVAGGKDNKIGDVIRNGIKDSLESMKNGGTVGQAAGGAAQGAQQGFLSNMMSMMGAASLRDMTSKFINGDYKGFFKEGGKGREMFNTAKSKVSNIFGRTREQVTDALGASSLTLDRRVTGAASRARDAVIGEDGLVDRGKGLVGRASDALNSNPLFQRIKGTAGRAANNIQYNRDNMALSSARGSLDNLDTDAIENFEDRMSAEAALMYYKRGEYDEARIEANKISNERLRKYIDERIKKIKDITEKREKGQTDLENGETPDIGATLQTAPESATDGADAEKSNPVVKVLKKGFSLIGKWFKKSAELVKNGSIDIIFGLKTLGSGLKQTFSILGKSLKKTLKPVKDAISKVGKTIKGAVTGAFSKMGDLFNKLKPRRDSESESGEGNEEQKRSLGERLGDKIRSSGTFGASFMTGFDEARAAKKKLSEAQERASSFVNRSVGDIMDVITGKKAMENSPFNQLLDVLKGFRSDVNGNHEEDMEAQEEAAEAAENAESNTEEGEESEGGVHNLHDAVDAVTGADGGAGGMKGLVEGIGKSLGGITQILMGIGEAALGVIMGMEGFKSLMNIGTELLQDILEPIDKIFKTLKKTIDSILKPLKDGLHDIIETLVNVVTSIIDILKPIIGMVKQLLDVVVGVILEVIQKVSDVLNTVVDLLASVVESIVDLLVPLLEAISDIINMLLEIVVPILDAVSSAVNAVISILNPILDLISVILDAVLVPILLVLDIIQPVIEGIGYTMKIVSGVLQLGMGIIIGILGSLLKGIGLIVSAVGAIPMVPDSVSELGGQIESTADGMLDSSKDLISGGIEQMKEGLNGIVSLAKGLVKTITGDEEEDVQQEEPEESDTSDVKLDTTDFGAGDVNSNTINNSWTYTYGSGNTSTTMNQHSYGGYMNMSERGCGPVVLADAYNRRNGGRMNPATLAASMMGSGTYDPRRGTSVGSMIDTGNAMGMGMRMGGVTQQSLRQASPSNPITVLGSGTGFGTKAGNNHYVNVIGTDRNGGAYVANPMTGRVERQSATNIALNSKLGLYGSGDEDNEYEQYGFSEELSDSFAALKELTAQLTGIFQGPSKEDEIAEQRAIQKDAESAKTISNNLTEEEYSALEQEARTKLETDNPKRDGESDEDYQKRIEKLWNKKGNSIIVELGGQQYADKVAERTALTLSGAESMQEAHNSMIEGMHAASGANLKAKSADKVGAVMAPYDPIRYTETNIDTSSSPASGASPVHDYFSATAGTEAYSTDGLWFEKSDAPVSKEGVGSKGNDHEGIGIRFYKDDSEVHAITDGTVTYVGTGGKHGANDPNGGLGNHVKWRDKAGMYHWFLHLNDIDGNIKEGANLSPGQLIGHVGSTGVTGYDNEDIQVLRYILTKAGPYGSTGDEGYVNPLTYWKFEETAGGQGSIQMTDTLSSGSAWGAHKNNNGVKKFIEVAQSAGMTPAQIATIMSTGIWEDGGEKLWGSKSLVNNTYDVNGQVATGIMNWVDTSVNYGNTVGEQLDYIRRTYFDASSGDFRATARETGYETEDINAYNQATARNGFTLKWGEKYGPLMETDLIEGSEHFFRGALVPGCIHEVSGVAKYVGTAADIYNWMVDEGIVATKDETQGDEKKITGRFVSTISNNTGGTGDGYFVSDGGVALADYGTPTVTATNISSSTSGNSPVHEFFGAMTKGSTSSSDGNWYGQRSSPNTSGQGSSGGSHAGVDFWWSSGETEGQEAHATCGGVVDRSEGGAVAGNYNANGGCGNNIRWIDDAGYMHWYMHMRDTPLLNAGDTVEPGQLVGYVGNTGNSYGAHLHYNINNSEGFNGWSSSQAVNPLTYFNNYNPSGSSGGSSGKDGENTGQHRGGFTNAGIQTNIYSGAGPFLPESKSSSKSNNKTPAGPVSKPTMQVKYDPLDPNSWTKIPASERGPYYQQLIDYNKQANKKSTGYAGTWGNTVDDNGYTPNTVNYWRSSLSDWSKSHVSNDFPDQLKELKKVLGKGDIGDFDLSSYIPPVDMSKFDQYDIGENSPIQQFYQQYEIVADTSSKIDMLEKMSKMTFNVRAQRVEELLEELIEKVSGDKPEPSSNNTDGYDPNLFRNDIPEQVSRLARG